MLSKREFVTGTITGTIGAALATAADIGNAGHQLDVVVEVGDMQLAQFRGVARTVGSSGEVVER